MEHKPSSTGSGTVPRVFAGGLVAGGLLHAVAGISLFFVIVLTLFVSLGCFIVFSAHRGRR